MDGFFWSVGIDVFFLRVGMEGAGMWEEVEVEEVARLFMTGIDVLRWREGCEPSEV